MIRALAKPGRLILTVLLTPIIVATIRIINILAITNLWLKR